MPVFDDLLEFDSAYGCVVAGVDEAGRGPWAGPVVAAAVILDASKIDNLHGVNDSKKLTAKKREKLYETIITSCVSYAVSEVSHTVIDRDNILKATMLAMDTAIQKLSVNPGIVLIDGTHCPGCEGKRTEAVKDGDAKSLSIAAASILAKVHRDRIMENYERIYPGYGFANNKGYGTKEHMEAIKRFGIVEIHRKSYKPVKEAMSGKD